MSFLAATSTATIVAAVSAAAAVGTLLVYVYVARRADINEAREEALALAETRGQAIADLERRLASLERQHRSAAVASAKRIRELEDALTKANSEARDRRIRCSGSTLLRWPIFSSACKRTSKRPRRTSTEH
jgi:hypothetical protein